jgi:ferritin-like metal-binding protein YciE
MTSDRHADVGREEIIDWLRDAYAMERGLESSLKKQAENEELSSEVRERAASHLQETKRHAEQVRGALQSLDTDTSSLKTGLGSATQALKGIGSVFARDEKIKDLLDAYSMEHFEIACYTALAAGALRAGLTTVAEVCQAIIPDEQRMAQTLLEALPREVTDYLFEKESVQK